MYFDEPVTMTNSKADSFKDLKYLLYLEYRNRDDLFKAGCANIADETWNNKNELLMQHQINGEYGNLGVTAEYCLTHGRAV